MLVYTMVYSGHTWLVSQQQNNVVFVSYTTTQVKRQNCKVSDQTRKWVVTLLIGRFFADWLMAIITLGILVSLVPTFLYSLAMPTQVLLSNPGCWSHVTKDLLMCLCLIIIMMVSLSVDVRDCVLVL